jgi:hypothetical protein
MMKCIWMATVNQSSKVKEDKNKLAPDQVMTTTLDAY